MLVNEQYHIAQIYVLQKLIKEIKTNVTKSRLHAALYSAAVIEHRFN